jgi:hypothetical protein
MKQSALVVLILGALAGSSALAEPNSAFSMRIYSIAYQCPGETPQTFQYTGARQVPPSNEVRLETQWYWDRSRTDRGQGCRILSIDDQPFRE